MRIQNKGTEKQMVSNKSFAFGVWIRNGAIIGLVGNTLLYAKNGELAFLFPFGLITGAISWAIVAAILWCIVWLFRTLFNKRDA